MRESRTSGSVRGDRGNSVPYRHRLDLKYQPGAETQDVDLTARDRPALNSCSQLLGRSKEPMFLNLFDQLSERRPQIIWQMGNKCFNVLLRIGKECPRPLYKR